MKTYDQIIHDAEIAEGALINLSATVDALKCFFKGYRDFVVTGSMSYIYMLGTTKGEYYKAGMEAAKADIESRKNIRG